MNKKKSEVRVNDQIRAREVRVVSEDGEQLGVLPLGQALDTAKDRGYDLVEVSSGSVPPVCRIMDYGKYKYQQKKRAQEAKKKQTFIVVKEVKLRPKTEEHDIMVKVRNVIRFLEAGNKAKVSVVYRGREMAHTHLGEVLLNRILEEVAEYAVVEKSPRMEGRTMSMLLGPKG